MKYLSIIMMFVCSLFIVGCSDDDKIDNTASVSNLTIGEVTSTSASLSAELSAASMQNFIKKGFCYSTSAEPTIDNATLCEMTGDFSATLRDLQPNTTYYVKAYALIGDNLVYTEQKQFTTPSKTLEDQLSEYICPAYVDDYVSMAGWDQRANWNLANVHDPSVMKAADGYYYMYQTDASYGNAHDGHGHFHARRSKDLVNWEYLGATMQEAPAWVKTKLNEIRAEQGLDPIENPSYGYWAPCARKVNDHLYRMYYCIVVNNYIKTGGLTYDGSWTERAFIGVMETSDPASNNWEDKGFVICSSSDKGTNWNRASASDWNAYFKFNAIDPSFIITPEGEHWLIYGSWHSGIAAVQLNPETGKTLAELPKSYGTAAEIAPYGKLIFTRTNGGRWQGAEAPEIVYHDGYYYLFLAYDGLDIPYNTRVLRSTKVDGPYETLNGAVTDASKGANNNPTVLTHPYKFSEGYGWVGISHCAVFDDGNGNWYYASQQRFPANVGGNAYSNAIMMGGVRSIQWESNGWPTVMPERYGAVPQASISESELVGAWEHIDLSYSYGNQRTASEMVLGDDHKITSGAWKGAAWSFNAQTNTLTCNGVELKVQREVDWEASPRKVTIVYSGLNGTKSYWGKKK
jgi:beta-xylosidase